MHSTYNIGDLSEGSSGGLESDDESGETKSTILKIMAAKNGPTTDKDHCTRSELSHMGSTSVDAVKSMDDNQIEMQSEFYVPDYVVT